MGGSIYNVMDKSGCVGKNNKQPDYKIEDGQRWDLQTDGQYRNEAGKLLMED